VCIYLGSARPIYIYTVYDCIFDDFPAINTVYTQYIYGSDQPYIYICARVHLCGCTQRGDVAVLVVITVKRIIGLLQLLTGIGYYG